jgi:hypothetical protein
MKGYKMKYEYTVEGEYITTDGGLDEYSAKFVLDESNEDVARAIIQNTLIHTHLRKDSKRKDYKRWKTCQVEECKPVDKDSDISVEMQDLISEATDLGCMPPNFNAIKKDDLKIKKLKEAIKLKKKRIKDDEEKNKKANK